MRVPEYNALMTAHKDYSVSGFKPPVALTIAGSDPSGGAGIQADLKTFHQRRVYGTSVITLITAQNTRGVSRVQVLDVSLVEQQLQAVLSDLPPVAAKTGALGNREVVEWLAEQAKAWSFPLVVDPVMISKSGAPLMEDSAIQFFVKRMVPRAFLITPNIPEAEAMTGISYQGEASVRRMALALRDLGARSVVIKGGHGTGPASDLLLAEGAEKSYSSPRIETGHTHGTGCTFSACITAELAKGRSLPEAVAEAKDFVTEAIRTHPGLGSGRGPVNHFAE